MRLKQICALTGFIVSIALSSSCSKLSELTQFTVDYKEIIEIPSTLGLNLPFNLVTPKIRTNSEEVFELNDTRKHLIEKVVLEQLELKVYTPEGADFSFLKSIDIFISSDDQEEILVAWINDINDTVGNSITLETTGMDLSSYLIADTFSLRFSTVTDKIPLSDHQIEVDASFFVDAKILGL